MTRHDEHHRPSWRYIPPDHTKRVCRLCGIVQHLIRGVWR